MDTPTNPAPGAPWWRTGVGWAYAACTVLAIVSLLIGTYMAFSAVYEYADSHQMSSPAWLYAAGVSGRTC
jgi:hypothetical protein